MATPTNDSFILIATAESSVYIESAADPLYRAVRCLGRAALDLAQKIVRDGEGRQVHYCQNQQGTLARQALKAAYAIAHSPLVKTAFFASDPNLGRILAAVGYAGIDDGHPSHKLWLDDVWWPAKASGTLITTKRWPAGRNKRKLRFMWSWVAVT